MPRIPLPQVGLQTAPTPQLPAPSIGGAPPEFGSRQATVIGQAASEFGSSVAAVANVLQDQVNDARVTEAYTKWSGAASDALSNPQDGFLYTEGKDATGDNRAAVVARIEKAGAELEGALQNDVQRGMFREAMAKHMIGVKERIYGHEAEQMRIDAIGQADSMRRQSIRAGIEAYMSRSLTPGARVEAAAAEALATGQDPQQPMMGPQLPRQDNGDEFTRMRNTALSQADFIANKKGWTKSDPRRKELALQTTTELNVGIAESMIAQGKTDAAAKFVAGLDAKEVEVGELSKLQKLVENASAADRGANLALDIVRATDEGGMKALAKERGISISANEVFGGDAYLKATAAVDEQFRAGKIGEQERRIALTEIEAIHARRRQAWADKSATTLQQAERVLSDPANRDLRINSAGFPAKLREDLFRYGQTDNASKFEGGVRRTTTDRDYADMLRAIDDGSVAKMTYSELYKNFYAKLSPENWNELKQFHASLNATHSVPHTSVFSDTDRMKSVAKQSGIILSPTGPKGEEEELKYAAFAKEVQRRVTEEETSKKAPVSDERLQQIADAVATTPSGFRESRTLGVDWLSSDPKAYPWEGIDNPQLQQSIYNDVWGDRTYLKALDDGQRIVNRKLTSFSEKNGVKLDDFQQAWFVQHVPAEHLDEVLATAVAASDGRPVTADKLHDTWLIVKAKRVPPPPPAATSASVIFDPGYYGRLQTQRMSAILGK